MMVDAPNAAEIAVVGRVSNTEIDWALNLGLRQLEPRRNA